MTKEMQVINNRGETIEPKKNVLFKITTKK
jgi:hypothetical protein